MSWAGQYFSLLRSELLCDQLVLKVMPGDLKLNHNRLEKLLD